MGDTQRGNGVRSRIVHAHGLLPYRGVMSLEEILKEALKLKPLDRFTVVDGLLRSLDQPDASIDAIWAEEAERRLTASC